MLGRGPAGGRPEGHVQLNTPWRGADAGPWSGPRVLHGGRPRGTVHGGLIADRQDAGCRLGEPVLAELVDKCRSAVAARQRFVGAASALVRSDGRMTDTMNSVTLTGLVDRVAADANLVRIRAATATDVEALC